MESEIKRVTTIIKSKRAKKVGKQWGERMKEREPFKEGKGRQ
jgi:hypothetical protein